MRDLELQRALERRYGYEPKIARILSELYHGSRMQWQGRRCELLQGGMGCLPLNAAGRMSRVGKKVLRNLLLEERAKMAKLEASLREQGVLA